MRMTASDRLEPDPNPLLAELTPMQTDLLEIIWRPVVQSTVSCWPVWDYVVRTFRNEHPNAPDCDDLRRSLPSIDGSGPRGDRYGLVWRTSPGFGTKNVNPSEIVGLTIAGLMQRSSTARASTIFPDEVATLVGTYARTEEEVSTYCDKPLTLATD